MKTIKSSRYLLPTLGLTAILGMGLAPFATAQNPSPAPTSPIRRLHGGGGRKERHPELRKAMRALENAKNALSNAAHDYDGHRVKALDATNQAIEQVKAALQSDKN